MLKSSAIITLVVMEIIIINNCDGLDLHESQLTAECGNCNPNPSLIHGGSSSAEKEAPW
jgi:hypothetical protein